MVVTESFPLHRRKKAPMHRIFVQTLGFVLCLGFPLMACATPSETCYALVAPMQTILTTVRQEKPLTEAQEAQWRTWNSSCSAASWQALLVTPETTPATPMVFTKSPSSLTFRDYVRAALEGFERGATAPRTVCTTRYASHKGRGAYYTSCQTY